MGFYKMQKRVNSFKNVTITCPCGHRVAITNKYKRLICSWCGNMVYLHKEDEFKDKLLKIINEKEVANEI